MDQATVRSVRSFNRTVTQRLGVLQDEYLGRGRPLGASRVLWEVSEDGTDLRALRTALDLDSGYLSRLIRSLEADGLVLVEPMFAVERLLTAGLVHVAVEDPTSDAARSCIESYFRELDERFEHGFDPSQTTSADADELVEPAGLFIVARLREEPIGCGALKFESAEPPEIKRMWVAPAARRLGVGRRIDRKSTRLNSSHANISYAVFCLKKKKTKLNIIVKKKTKKIKNNKQS